ncbi:FadR/GntR family transcriptional regulator [Rhodococcus sp. NPDC060176]|uniref:FadR/GntR family transcriptional regulator n=1 Tax=Rhodococcus sp. NPDC060176 TaxID=3347062 RepID=UPI00364D875F
MAERIRPVARPRLYEVIVEQLCDHIATRNMQPGERLPPERELAGQLGVSRASLSQAFVALEVQGILSVRHGDGAVLVRRPVEGTVIRALREHADRLPDVIEAREALEVKLAELAASRRSDDEMTAIDRALWVMASEITEGDRGVSGDELFHNAITEAAHSPLLARLMSEIAGLIRETRIESLSQSGRPKASLGGHRRIAEAVRQRDSMAAGRAMAEHIRLVSDVALLRPQVAD